MGLISLLYFCKNLKILGRVKMPKPILLIICIVLLSLTFFNCEGHMIGHNPHHRKEILDSQGKFEVEWLVDFDAKRITFNLTVFTKGYVGFGLSRNGSMSGADVVIGGVTPNGRSYFSDRYSVGDEIPLIDQTQHWALSEAYETTHTFLSFTRALDTCDPEDYPITRDKVTLIWAYGDSDTEITYHNHQRGSYDVYLLDPDYSPKIIRDAVQGVPKVIGRENLELKLWSISKRIEIPSNETSYLCTIHKGPRLEKKHHLLGFDVQIPSDEHLRHIRNVHIYKCNAPPGIHGRSFFEPYVKSPSQSCLAVEDPEGEMPTNYCTEKWMDGWIQGGKTYFTPNDIGYPLGLNQDEFYMVQTNYFNPEQKEDVIVEFEIELYYTSLLRQHEAGILQIGHEIPGLTPSLLIPPNSHGHMIFGHCGSECTKLMFPSSGIKIFAVSLHARNSGRKLQLQHFRNSRELPWISTDDNYSASYQTIKTLREHIRVLPGDHLIMKCVFDNTWTDNGTVVGGSLVHQEICIANIHYYNKIDDFASCKSEIISEEYKKRFLGITNVTWDNALHEFVVSSPGHHEGRTVAEVSNNHVLWEPEIRAEFERFHKYHPQINKCSKELYAKSETRGPKDDYSGSTAYPFAAKEFQPERSCSLGLSYK